MSKRKSVLDLIASNLIFVIATPFLTIFISMGLMLGFFDEYKKIGEKEVADFLWQLIQFCFILAALLGFDTRLSSKRSKKVIFVMLGCTMAGVLFILSMGLAVAYIQNHLYYIPMLVCVNFAVVMLSVSIAVFFIEVLQKMIQTFRG